MNHSFKAAVLSGLVFPGLGQVVLKQYKRGVVLALAFSAFLLGIVVTLSRRAMVLLDRIQWEGGFIDLSTISEAVARVSQSSDDRILTGLFLALLASWIVGVVDAYLIGRKQDRAEVSKSRTAR
jgi:hypothetical protein